MEAPSLHDQFEEIWDFVHKKCVEESKLILVHALDTPAPACEMAADKPVQRLNPESCDCAECTKAKDWTTPALKICPFCHYAYHDKPVVIHGFYGMAFVRCPNCGQQHSWENQ